MDNQRKTLIELTEKYKSSWFPELGRCLYEVKYKKLYEDWRDDNGDFFRSFTQYCRHDLHISSSAASDIAAAYRYISVAEKKLLSSCPSDGRIPGYNDIVLLIRSKEKISEYEFARLHKMLFSDQIGREKLRGELRNLIPTEDSELKELREEVCILRTRVEQLETECKNLRSLSFCVTEAEVKKLRRGISRFIHPDAGGDNDVMRDFNVFIEKLLDGINGIDHRVSFH